MSDRDSGMSEIPGEITDADAARMFVSLSRRRAELAWTVELVKVRLEEAARGCERLVGRVGPKAIKAGGWPDWELWGDPTMHDRNCAYEGARDGTRGPDRRALGRGGASEIEVSRIEQAILWPAHYLSAPRHEDNRKALQLWLWCCAKNKSFDEFHRALGVSRMTAYRRIDRAAKTILEGVERDGVLP